MNKLLILLFILSPIFTSAQKNYGPPIPKKGEKIIYLGQLHSISANTNRWYKNADKLDADYMSIIEDEHTQTINVLDENYQIKNSSFAVLKDFYVKFYKAVPIDSKEKGKNDKTKEYWRNAKVVTYRVFRDGPYKLYYPNGAIKEEGTFTKRIRDKVQKIYYENGNLKLKQQYANGNIEGQSYGYYENGTLKSVIDYKNGVANGEIQIFYENGNLKEKGTLINGLMEGEYKRFYPDGVVNVIWNFLKEKKNGEVLVYDKDGKLESKTNFNNNLKHGVYERYANGVLREKGNYFYGKEHGNFDTFDSKGELTIRLIYDYGVRTGIENKQKQ